MTKKQEKLELQIRLFLSVRRHTPQKVDCEQAMREMMEEINYWRMVAKHPGAVERPRGGQKTAEMDSERYQHMIGYLTGKHSINQAEAAEIISEHSMSVTGRSPKPKTILELVSGWKKIISSLNSQSFLREGRKHYVSALSGFYQSVRLFWQLYR